MNTKRKKNIQNTIHKAIHLKWEQQQRNNMDKKVSLLDNKAFVM